MPNRYTKIKYKTKKITSMLLLAVLIVMNGPMSAFAAWSEQEILLPSDLAAGDHFSKGISISGDYAVVGSMRDHIVGEDEGSAYIFKRNGTDWQEILKLVPSDSANNQLFGSSIEISDDYIIVGAQGDNIYGDASGSAYIFEKNGDIWGDPLSCDGITDFICEETQKIVPSSGASYDLYGESIAINGDYALVGAHQDDTGNQGAAYIYERSAGGVWGDGVGGTDEKQKLTVSDRAANDHFSAYSVSISNTYAIIGAYGDDSYQGAAYIYERSAGGVWGDGAGGTDEKQKLTASDGVNGDQFSSVSIEGSIAVIGAAGDDSYKGSVYTFERSVGGVWGDGAGSTDEKQKFYSSDGVGTDNFGVSTAINGDYIIAGAYPKNSNTGSAYIFNYEPEPVVPEYNIYLYILTVIIASGLMVQIVPKVKTQQV